jgi:hypothetical protein
MSPREVSKVNDKFHMWYVLNTSWDDRSLVLAIVGVEIYFVMKSVSCSEGVVTTIS